MSIEANASATGSAPAVIQSSLPVADAPANVAAPAAATPTATPAAEPAKEPEQPQGPTPDQLAHGFAQLTRREAKLREREAALKAEGAAIAKLREAAGKKSALAVLEAAGLTYEEATDEMLRTGTGRRVEDDVAELRKRVEDREKAAEAERATATAAQQQQIVTQFRANVTAAIKGAGDTYELINAKGEHDEVWAVIEGHFERTRELMPWAKAAALVEAQLEADAKLVLGTKKLGGLKPAEPKSENGKAASDTRSTTLSNDLAPSAPTVGGKDEFPLDPEERTRAISRRFGWLS